MCSKWEGFNVCEYVDIRKINGNVRFELDKDTAGLLGYYLEEAGACVTNNPKIKGAFDRLYAWGEDKDTWDVPLKDAEVLAHAVADLAVEGWLPKRPEVACMADLLLQGTGLGTYERHARFMAGPVV